jgi:prepilin-type N-terminal cleavage/methylation domain-containing protein
LLAIFIPRRLTTNYIVARKLFIPIAANAHPPGRFGYALLMHFSELGAPSRPGTVVAVQRAVGRPRGSVIPRPMSLRKHPKRFSGFSMIESMVVVAIIGAMAATMMPSISRMMAENRQHRAAVEVMLAARRAREEALFGGYATALHFAKDPNDNGAVITPVTGLTSRCNRGAFGDYDGIPFGWQALLGSPPVAMARFNFGGQEIRATLTIGATEQDEAFLCWEPRGECWYGTSPYNAIGAPASVMRIARFVGDDSVGTDRQVVFPASCTARLR